MLVDLIYRCTDKFGSWIGQTSGFADSDNDALNLAKREITRLRERYSDTEYTNVCVYEPDLSPDCKIGDRLICEIN